MLSQQNRPNPFCFSWFFFQKNLLQALFNVQQVSKFEIKRRGDNPVMEGRINNEKKKKNGMKNKQILGREDLSTIKLNHFLFEGGVDTRITRNNLIERSNLITRHRIHTFTTIENKWCLNVRGRFGCRVVDDWQETHFRRKIEATVLVVATLFPSISSCLVRSFSTRKTPFACQLLVIY